MREPLQRRRVKTCAGTFTAMKSESMCWNLYSDEGGEHVREPLQQRRVKTCAETFTAKRVKTCAGTFRAMKGENVCGNLIACAMLV